MLSKSVERNSLGVLEEVRGGTKPVCVTPNKLCAATKCIIEKCYSFIESLKSKHKITLHIEDYLRT